MAAGSIDIGDSIYFDQNKVEISQAESWKRLPLEPPTGWGLGWTEAYLWSNNRGSQQRAWDGGGSYKLVPHWTAFFEEKIPEPEIDDKDTYFKVIGEATFAKSQVSKPFAYDIGIGTGFFINRITDFLKIRPTDPKAPQIEDKDRTDYWKVRFISDGIEKTGFIEKKVAKELIDVELKPTLLTEDKRKELIDAQNRREKTTVVGKLTSTMLSDVKNDLMGQNYTQKNQNTNETNAQNTPTASSNTVLFIGIGLLVVVLLFLLFKK